MYSTDKSYAPFINSLISTPATAIGSNPTAVKTENLPPTSSGTTKVSYPSSVANPFKTPFALSVVKRINEFASEASERNDLNFSCYATPKTKRSVGASTVM